MSSDDEELAKLMREIDAVTGPSPSAGAAPAQPPVPATSKEVAKSDDGSGSRGKWALIAAAGGGVVGFIVGSILWFLPGFSGVPTALGAALGAAIIALISGPPNWMK